MMERSERKEEYWTIHLDQVKEMLGLKGHGYRSVLTWCSKHEIPVIGSGKRRRILKSHWIRVNQNACVDAIKTMHPRNWREMLRFYGVQAGATRKVKGEPKHYSPRGNIAKNFLKKTDGE